MSNPTAQVQVSVNGGAYTSGFITAAAASTLQYRQNPSTASGAASYTWELTDYAPALTPPSGWSNINGVYTYYGATPPVVTLPGAGSNSWGPFSVRLRLNGNPLAFTAQNAPNPLYQPQLTDEATVVDVVSPQAGMVGLHFNAATQYDTLRSWVGMVMQSLRAIDSYLSGLSGSLIPWTRLSHATTGTVLTSSQQKVMLDTTGGACLAVAMASPADGQPVKFKDNKGNFGVTAGQFQGNTGQKVEYPMAPGTFTATGGTVSFPIQGGTFAYEWGSTENTWFLV